MHPRLIRHTLSRLTLIAAASLALGTCASPGTDYLDQLAALAAHTGTRVTPRLTISPPVLPDSDVAAPREMLRLAGRINRAIAAGRADAQTLHAAGLLALIWADPSRSANADSAIAFLQSALSIAGPDAAILADLSAAHLVRAEQSGAECHLLLALDPADSALALDPRNATARYGFASALDRLWLGEEARDAWSRYLSIEAPTVWTRRARERLRALQVPAPLPRPADGAAAEWRRLAERDAQRARMLVMDSVLPEWGAAVLQGQADAARNRLASAAAVAAGLARRPGHDQSVQAMVEAIRRVEHDASTTRALAIAHVRYGRGQDLLGRRLTEAEGEFREAARYAATSEALREWVEFSRALSRWYAGHSDSALPVFRQLARRTDATRFPVLAARAHWSIGTSMLRARDYTDAMREYDAAAELLERAGEEEYFGAVRGLRFETLASQGNPDPACGEMVAAARVLGRHRHSRYFHNLLYVAAQESRVDGMSRAARVLEDLDVQATRRITPDVHAEALLLRARGRAAAGETGAAARDATTAKRVMEPLPPEFQRAWIEKDLVLADAQVQAWTDPAAAAEALDTAVLFYAARNLAIRLVPTLALRADTRLRAGNTAGAVADLDSAASVLGALGGTVESAQIRAQMLETGRALYDRLAMVHARARRPAEALRALERSRVSFGPVAAAAARLPLTLAAPAGETVLEYALVGDTLLAFMLTADTLHMGIRPVDAHRLAREVAALRTALESGAPEEAVRGQLAWLYATLIQPVRKHVPAGARLVLVTDGELAAIPFTALVTGGGQYLVQEHEIRVAPSIAQAREPARTPAAGPAVFVADPALSDQDQVSFPPLPLLARATQDIAAGVPGSELLQGSAAKSAAVRAALSRASVFHFSGHAVFDDDRPERSYLLLAPDSAGPGRLTAGEIARLNLPRLRLVVLSACETQSSAKGRSGGFAGLSGAILAAGATGVLGSLWEVSEAPSARLIREFYRAYTPGRGGAGALRQAQLRMIDSRDPALRSPSAWAGFRFAGR